MFHTILVFFHVYLSVALRGKCAAAAMACVAGSYEQEQLVVSTVVDAATHHMHQTIDDLAPKL
jgi:hypothetical protein